MKKSKRYQENIKKIKNVKNVEEAVEILKSLKKPKFDESVEVHLVLNFDKKKNDHQLRFSLVLPHGIGKVSRIALFITKDRKEEAEKLKPEQIYTEEDISLISKEEKISFDIALATPKMMPYIAKIARILGPKGLMPNPKNETVTDEIEKAVELVRKGKLNIKSDASGCIHQTIGKLSQEQEKIAENYNILLEAVKKEISGKSKDKPIKKIFITSTMGPAIQIL